MEHEGLLVAEREIEVNNYDIDAMGIVSNIVYIRWFEDLRTIFINEYMTFSEMMKQHISPILMKTEIEYKVPPWYMINPLGVAGLLKVEEWNGYLNSKLRLRQSALYWQQTGGFLDLERQRITKMPEVFQNLLK